MTFVAGIRLWLLVAVIALLGFYVWRQRRRPTYAARFTNLALLDTVLPKRPGWQRHVPAAALLLALVALTTAFARPARTSRIPVKESTVIVAVDVSGSMAATDVAPSRLEAARVAAAAFVKLLPPRFNIGLVSFDQSATVLVAPTNDHSQVAAAIKDLQSGGGTAIGEAIYASLGSIPAVDTKSGQAAPARIVLMSDGSTNSGRPNEEAAAAAAAAHVPVTTIAYGTDTGQVTIGSRVIDVPADKAALESIANSTGGKFFQAASATELNKVYAAIRSAVSTRVLKHDISGIFMGVALVLLILAAVGSLVWSPRLV
jgi:Ca-activated chloride channel family protein